jgi:uncharacterized damage-inducible protein DinB
MTSVLLELVRHKTWATQKLFALCESIDPSLLDAPAPGTYGTVRATLVHLVNGDGLFHSRLSGGPQWQLPRPAQYLDEATTTLQTAAERFAEIAGQWESLAADAELADRDIVEPDGRVFKGATWFAQSIHHADAHRAQVLTSLGSRGIKVPELDLWEYIGIH